MHDITWSYSVIARYNKCPYAVKLSRIDRVKEPPLPLAEGVTQHANERGTDIHNAIEAFISGTSDTIPEAALGFEANIRQLKALYDLGFVQQEQKWGIDREWGDTHWDKAWGRMQLDAFIYEPGTPTALIVDYKTGKYFGNEMAHSEQGSLYQAGAFARYPELRTIIVEFWYVDHNVILTKRYVRTTLPLTIGRYNRMVDMINMDSVMRPKPDKFTCKYCGYAEAICPFAFKQ